MTTFGQFVERISPKFNLQVVEGLSYHRLLKAVEYIDKFIRYSVSQKTNTHLEYLGYKELSPKEEMAFLFNKASRSVYDIAENDIYLVEFYVRYGGSDEIKACPFYVPFLNKGNTMHMSGGKFLVMPTLADKVISIGRLIIFINIVTAKYSFTRTYAAVMVNDKFNRIPVVNTELYKNQAKKLEDTTKARTTVMHYLLANYGYSATMQMLLGFVPKPVYDADERGCVVIKSTTKPPHGYIKSKEYRPTHLKFLVPEDKYNETVLYCLGNVFYIVDNFPEIVTITELDNTVMWKRLLAEIIHSGNHGLSYLSEKINAHFSDLNSSFDTITIGKLNDVGVQANTLMQLLAVIFQNFNTWIMHSESRSLCHNKSYEVESFALAPITSRITRTVLDISKEELRVNGAKLDPKAVDKILNKYMKARSIFILRKGCPFVTSVEYAGDHLYPKHSAMVVQQESDYVDVDKGANTSERQTLTASAATVGSLLNLSKNNPIPLLRINPYVKVDPVTGTILPHEHLEAILEETEKLLSNTSMVDSDTLERLDNIFPGDGVTITDDDLDADMYEDDDVPDIPEID
ncbi:MAG: hypothetical protein PHN51_11645 [Candidatus Nanopelagicales bacterium]|nr:hypothetical protein [Candidatus Nanopelagicales bacterium]